MEERAQAEFEGARDVRLALRRLYASGTAAADVEVRRATGGRVLVSVRVDPAELASMTDLLHQVGALRVHRRPTPAGTRAEVAGRSPAR